MLFRACNTDFSVYLFSHCKYDLPVFFCVIKTNREGKLSSLLFQFIDADELRSAGADEAETRAHQPLELWYKGRLELQEDSGSLPQAWKDEKDRQRLKLEKKWEEEKAQMMQEEEDRRFEDASSEREEDENASSSTSAGVLAGMAKLIKKGLPQIFKTQDNAGGRKGESNFLKPSKLLNTVNAELIQNQLVFNFENQFDFDMRNYWEIQKAKQHPFRIFLEHDTHVEILSGRARDQCVVRISAWDYGSRIQPNNDAPENYRDADSGAAGEDIFMEGEAGTKGNLRARTVGGQGEAIFYPPVEIPKTERERRSARATAFVSTGRALGETSSTGATSQEQPPSNKIKYVSWDFKAVNCDQANVWEQQLKGRKKDKWQHTKNAAGDSPPGSTSEAQAGHLQADLMQQALLTTAGGAPSGSFRASGTTSTSSQRDQRPGFMCRMKQKFFQGIRSLKRVGGFFKSYWSEKQVETVTNVVEREMEKEQQQDAAQNLENLANDEFFLSEVRKQQYQDRVDAMDQIGNANCEQDCRSGEELLEEAEFGVMMADLIHENRDQLSELEMEDFQYLIQEVNIGDLKGAAQSVDKKLGSTTKEELYQEAASYQPGVPMSFGPQRTEDLPAPSSGAAGRTFGPPGAGGGDAGTTTVQFCVF